MRKKIFTIVLTIVLSVALPVSVYAANSITIECAATTLAPGGSTVCTIKGSSDEGAINSAGFKATTSGDITLTDAAVDSSFSGTITDYNFPVYNSNETERNVTFGTITIKANDDAAEGSENYITLTKADESEVESVYIGLAGDDGGNKELADIQQQITISTSGGSPAQSDEPSSNPQTMDTNVMLITLLLLGTAIVVYVGKKKLVKIGK